MQALIMVLMFLIAVFLVLVILVQRGRGGGLAGALGGMGGQSAFGTKAGDLFTRITIVVAAVWVLLCIGSLKYLNSNEQGFGPDMGASAPAPLSEGEVEAAPGSDAKQSEKASEKAESEQAAPEKPADAPKQ